MALAGGDGHPRWSDLEDDPHAGHSDDMPSPSGLWSRLKWGVADQAVSSFTNLLLAVVVARSISVRGFGAFGVAFSAYALALGASRSIVGEPLGIRHSASSAEAGRRALAQGAGTALALGVLAGVVCALMAIVLRGSLGLPLAALAVSLPGLLLQDAWRYGFVATGQPRKALVNDLVWAAAQVLFIGSLIAYSDPTVAGFLLAWGAAASLAAVVGGVQAGVAPTAGYARQWLSRHDDLWPRFLVEFGAMTGTWQVTMVLIGGVAGLSAVGSLRAAQTLLGPLNLIFLSVPLIALPELSRLSIRRPKAVVPVSATIGVGLASLALLGGMAVWAVPDWLGQELLGESLVPARSVLLPVTIFLASTGVNIGAILGLRSMGAANRSVRVRLAMAPILVSAGAIGAVLDGAFGAAVGLAVANWLAAIAWWWQLTGTVGGGSHLISLRRKIASVARAGRRRAGRSRAWLWANRMARTGRSVAGAVPLPTPAKRRLARLRLRPGVSQVALSRLLLGGENGLSAAEYSAATGDLLRPSTPIAAWPHVELLERFVAEGPSALVSESFNDSRYLANARTCIAATGHYFGARDDEGVRAVASDFVLRFTGLSSGDTRPSQSGPQDPIRVRLIRNSTCFEVVDGHHRLAARLMRGETDVEVVVERRRVWTPLQALLREMSWLEGRLQLYQPISAPELRDWPQVRRCTDRRDRMLELLSQVDVTVSGSTYLDVASCYGWFVAQMAEVGFDAYGMERDPLGREVAEQVYGVERHRIEVGDCVELLGQLRSRHDVVSCFSLLHHFVLGRGSCSAERLAKLLDSVTGRVLFLDTGQAHEAWFKDTLPDWDADFIEGWLREHTSFDDIVRLGSDDDDVPPFEQNYGRMLFACVRHSSQSGNASVK